MIAIIIYNDLEMLCTKLKGKHKVSKTTFPGKSNNYLFDHYPQGGGGGGGGSLTKC